MDNDETVEISYDEIRHDTGKATLFVAGEEKFWIPNSLIEGITNEDGPGEVTIPEWFAIQEGLI